jgi:hypothetical protein
LPVLLEAGSLEYPVKAAFLLNFASFAEWPQGSPQATSPHVSICVLGEDPFGSLLDEVVHGRTIGGRPVDVPRHLGPESVGRCHVLFVSTSETSRLDRILREVSASPVLTVGESRGFLERGGAIRLLVEDNRVRFEVQLRPAARHGPRLSSRLLSLARTVRK